MIFQYAVNENPDAVDAAAVLCTVQVIKSFNSETNTSIGR